MFSNPGSFVDAEPIGVSEEARALLQYLASITPNIKVSKGELDGVIFHGNDLPCIPGPLKSQAFAAALLGMTAVLARQIATLRGVNTGAIKIDTDAADLYPATAAVLTVDAKLLDHVENLTDFGVDVDKRCVDETNLTYRTWAIYPSKDPRVWYQALGNLNPRTWLSAHDIDPNTPADTKDEAYGIIKDMTTKYSGPEVEAMHLEHGFCAQTVLTPKQWRECYNGRRLAAHPLINVKQVLGTQDVPPVAFAESRNGDQRPLAGLKILELARVIAAPALGATLASLGADVIKAQSPNLHDLQPLSLTLTAGKRTVSIEMNNESDKAQLRFGLEQAVENARKRGKGVIYLDLNTYGPDGYYAERPGYQQIADAASGRTYVTARSLGQPEGVGILPPLPIADMLTGALGVIDILLAVRERATKGGSYHCLAALTAVDALQVTEEVGLYPQQIVDKIQATYKFGHMGPETSCSSRWCLGRKWQRDSGPSGYVQYFRNGLGEGA